MPGSRNSTRRMPRPWMDWAYPSTNSAAWTKRSAITEKCYAWNPTGPGATSANPTGLATIAFLSVLTLFRMALLQTVFVIGLVVGQ